MSSAAPWGQLARGERGPSKGSRALTPVPAFVPRRSRGCAWQAGELQFFSVLAALGDHDAFNAYLAPLRRQEWVVYAKRLFAGSSSKSRQLMNGRSPIFGAQDRSEPLSHRRPRCSLAAVGYDFSNRVGCRSPRAGVHRAAVRTRRLGFSKATFQSRPQPLTVTTAKATEQSPWRSPLAAISCNKVSATPLDEVRSAHAWSRASQKPHNCATYREWLC